MNNLDLNSPPPNHNFKVAIERAESDGEHKVRLFKDVVLFILSVAFVALIAFLCVSALMSTTNGPEEKKWAMSVLSAITGGIVGYLVKR